MVSANDPRTMIETIEITAGGGIPAATLDAIRERLALLDRYTDEPIAGARLTLRRGPGRSDARYEADASVLFTPKDDRGRVLAAHVAGPSPAEAADAAVERLRRQLRRVVTSEVAKRDEPARIRQALADLGSARIGPPQASLKAPEERQIVRRRTYSDRPKPTLEAIADMLDLDELFHLFVHARTSEDVVVHRRPDRRIGLIHPRGSVLADETDDLVVAEPSRYSEPLSLADARAEEDVVNHIFLYFIDVADRRGKVLYLRNDGDYGLVEPE